MNSRAPCELAFLVVADGGALGPSPGGDDRSVEVEGDADQFQGGQTLEDHAAQEAAEMIDAPGVGLLEHATEGGHVGQALEREETLNHRVVPVRAAVPQFAEAQQPMNDELKEDHRLPEDLAGGPMAETRPQPGLEIKDGEELLDENEPGEGRERLVLELDDRKDVGLTADLGSAKLHEADLLVLCVFYPFYTRQGVKFAFCLQIP
jgi:hypothetical protein